MSTFKIAVLISAGGTTLKNLIDKQSSGELHAKIALVISSNRSAGGIKFAEAAEIPVTVLEPSEFSGVKEFSAAIFDQVRATNCELVVLGGFLKLIEIPEDFTNRVINIHPSLIPAHCGKGFYGIKVHQSVLESGDRRTGCTIHFVDNEYDHGPIISQKVVEVFAEDTPESLAARVFQVECNDYPNVINMLANQLHRD